MAEPVRILHVDDDEEFTELVATFLEREDDRFSVDTATSANEAIDRLDGEAFDCIVSDYEMPGLDGIELLEAVRADRPDLPFILYTGKGSEEIASDAISAGVTEYLQKGPGTSQYEVLAHRISNAVEKHRSRARMDTIEERLSLLAETTDDILFMFDGDWSELLFINSAYEDIWGESIDRLRADPTSFLEHIHPDDRAAAEASMERLSNGESDLIEYRVVGPDGEQRWIRGDSTPVLDDDGSVTSIVGVVRDITEEKIYEQELERLKDRYQALFDNAPGPVIAHDVQEGGDQQPIWRVNEAFERVFGYDAAEVVGKDVGDVVVPEDDRERHAEFLERAAGGEAFTAEVERLTADGPREFLLHVIPFGIAGSETADGWYAWYTDITEQKRRRERLAQQQSLFEAVMETSIDGILVVDQDREYVTWNQRYQELWGIPDDSIGEDQEAVALDWVRDQLEDPEEFDQRIDYLYDHPGEESRDQIRLTDGRIFDRYSAPVQGADGTHFGRVWFYRDITERVEYEAELQRTNERLEEFASIVSHDLRNPLSVAQGRLELAKGDCESEHHEPIDRALDRIEAIIDDLLSVAREGGSISELEVVALDDVANACWTTVDTRDATLEVSASSRIQADEGRLKQLLENLFRNAVEHGGESVGVTVGEFDGGFYVEDDGPGIPPEDRERVFQSGYSTLERGTGFGLAIVKQIAGAHDWEIRISEGQRGGTRFEISGVAPAE